MQNTEIDLLEKISITEKRVAVFGTAGRWICAVLFIAMCIAIGLGNVAWRIAAVCVFAAVFVAYLVAVMTLTKKLDVMRTLAHPEPEIDKTETFNALVARFDLDELREFSSRVAYASLRAFRDDLTLEVEFVFGNGAVISALFENDRARLVSGEEELYCLDYEKIKQVNDIFDALTAQLKILAV